MAPRLDQSTRAIPRGGYRARFSPSGFLISTNIQTRQKISCYLGTGRALITHNEPVGRENYVDIICLPPHKSQTVTRG